MAMFEGATSDVSVSQLEYISNVLDEQGFGNAKVTVKAVGEAGDNYASTVKRFIAEKDGNTFSMVAKIAPTLEQMRAVGNSSKMFENEYVMYTEVLPRFTELEKAAGVPEAERLRYAVSYGGTLEAPYELILLEDLQIPGFVMLDRFKSLSDETVRLVLKNFARLHSLSYALKHQDPEAYEAFKNKLTNNWDAIFQSEYMFDFFTTLENDASSMLTSEVHKNALKNTVSKLATLIAKLIKIDRDSRYSVIQQGDAWTNNIMFKFEEEKPAVSCMIDYQLSKSNSPVSDLYYMILNCTDYATRSKHFVEWIDYYHSQLNHSLFLFGLKADYFYPRDQLDADLKRHGRVSLGLAVVVASALTRQSADAAKLKELMDQENIEEMKQASRMAAVDSETADLFRTRVAGVIDSLLEYGYL